MNSFNEEELYQWIKQTAENFGAAEDLFHPDYGWILRYNKVTEAGKRFFEDHKEHFTKEEK